MQPLLFSYLPLVVLLLTTLVVAARAARRSVGSSFLFLFRCFFSLLFLFFFSWSILPLSARRRHARRSPTRGHCRTCSNHGRRSSVRCHCADTCHRSNSHGRTIRLGTLHQSGQSEPTSSSRAAAMLTRPTRTTMSISTPIGYCADCCSSAVFDLLRSARCHRDLDADSLRPPPPRRLAVAVAAPAAALRLLRRALLPVVCGRCSWPAAQWWEWRWWRAGRRRRSWPALRPVHLLPW